MTGNHADSLLRDMAKDMRLSCNEVLTETRKYLDWTAENGPVRLWEGPIPPFWYSFPSVVENAAHNATQRVAEGGIAILRTQTAYEESNPMLRSLRRHQLEAAYIHYKGIADEDVTAMRKGHIPR